MRFAKGTFVFCYATYLICASAMFVVQLVPIARFEQQQSAELNAILADGQQPRGDDQPHWKRHAPALKTP